MCGPQQKTRSTVGGDEVRRQAAHAAAAIGSPSSQHVAQHRDAPAAARPAALPQHLEAPRASKPGWRCSFRRSARGRRRCELRARACRGAPALAARCRRASAAAAVADIGAERADRQQHAPGCSCTQCRPGAADAVAAAACRRSSARDRRCTSASSRQSVSRAPRAVRARRSARIARPCPWPCGGDQAVEMRIVAVEHGGAAGRHAVEDLGLGVGDRLDRGEELDMHRLDRGDDRDVRAHHAATAARSRRHGSCRARTRRRRVSRGMRARLSGTPHWLLRLPALAKVGASGAEDRAPAPPWCWSCRRCR